MTSEYPNQHPNTLLTLSAHPDVSRENHRTPDVSRWAVRRILDTRRRIEARMWAARSVVVAEQLRQMRGSFS